MNQKINPFKLISALLLIVNLGAIGWLSYVLIPRLKLASHYTTTTGQVQGLQKLSVDSDERVVDFIFSVNGKSIEDFQHSYAPNGTELSLMRGANVTVSYNPDDPTQHICGDAKQYVNAGLPYVGMYVAILVVTLLLIPLLNKQAKAYDAKPQLEPVPES